MESRIYTIYDEISEFTKEGYDKLKEYKRSKDLNKRITVYCLPKYEGEDLWCKYIKDEED